MSLRIEGASRRSSPVTITVDGQPVAAFAGESVAAALLAAGIYRLRSSPLAASPRGMFCWIGICQECVVAIEGRTVPACQEPVREGLEIVLLRNQR
ncbi:MAG: (2Fe-2S)-binding protein [Proteobacteria bacterium]|nr:(2Fe-2S)-binding protein [Pseudomonadota bacterium]